MNVRVKTLDSGASGGFLIPSDEDLRIISRAEYAGHDVKAEDLHVRHCLLAHDQFDRSGERFPKAYLDQFAATLPGKSVLMGHDTSGPPPVARFHVAGTKLIAEPAFPVLNVAHVAKVDKLTAASGDGDEGSIPGFANRAANVRYLNAGFYFPNDASTEALRKHIDMGVYKHASIGFRYDDLHCDLCEKSYLGAGCRHVLMQPDMERGKLATGTYSGDATKAEALHGSIVYLGCQPRAQLMKALADGEAINVEACAETLHGQDLVALKEAEFFARRFGHARKVWSFPALTKAEPDAAATDPVADDLTGSKTAEGSEGTPPDGVTFEQQTMSTLDVLTSLVDRAEAIEAKRAENGQHLGKARRADLAQIGERIAALLGATEEKVVPDVEEARAARLRRLKAEAMAMEAGILVPG